MQDLQRRVRRIVGEIRDQRGLCNPVAFGDQPGVQVADMGGSNLAAAADQGGALRDPAKSEIGVAFGGQVVAGAVVRGSWCRGYAALISENPLA